MKLTADELIEAILNAPRCTKSANCINCSMEKLQAELREAMIAQLIASPPPNDSIISGAPTT